MKSTDNRGNLHLNSLVEYNIIRKDRFREIRTKVNQVIADLNQTDANIMTKKFKEIGAWGWAFWNWNYLHDSTPDFNLITVTPNGSIETTKYFEFLKNAVGYS